MSNMEQITAALQELRGAAAAVQTTRNEVAALKRAVDGKLDDLEGRLALKPSKTEILELTRTGAMFAERDAPRGMNGMQARSSDTRDMGPPSEHMRAFTDFLRNPRSVERQAALAEHQRNASGATEAAGGFLVPQEIIGPLQMRARDANPFRGLIRTVSVATRDLVFPLSNADAATGWVGENAARPATTVPTLTGAKPTFGTLYALVAASEELTMDSQFDVGQWFAMEAGAAMGAAEMTAIISGNGTNRPSGLFRVPPETGADGTRTAGALRALEVTGLNDPALADKLIDLVYDLKADYRQRGTWCMNSQTAGVIRKLKDIEGRFIWADGLAAAEPARLLGYPVVIAEGMPGGADEACPIAFGDFDRAYILAENGALRITIDDNITVPGQVRWYIRARLGGCVYDSNAVRVLKVNAP